MQRTAKSSLIRGFTLIEQAVVCTVAASVLATAAPSFQQMNALRQVVGTAEQLRTHISYARSLAVAERSLVHMRFESSAGRSCYVVYTGEPGDCSCDVSTVCKATAVAHAVWRAESSSMAQIRANVNEMSFEPNYGTTIPASTATIIRTGASTLRVVTNIMGRVRTCAVERREAGFPKC